MPIQPWIPVTWNTDVRWKPESYESSDEQAIRPRRWLRYVIVGVVLLVVLATVAALVASSAAAAVDHGEGADESPRSAVFTRVADPPVRLVDRARRIDRSTDRSVLAPVAGRAEVPTAGVSCAAAGLPAEYGPVAALHDRGGARVCASVSPVADVRAVTPGAAASHHPYDVHDDGRQE